MLRSCTDVCLNDHPTWPPLPEAVSDAAAVRRHYYTDVINQSRISTHRSGHTVPVESQRVEQRTGSSHSKPVPFRSRANACNDVSPPIYQSRLVYLMSIGPSRAASHASPARPRPRFICHGAGACCMQGSLHCCAECAVPY